MRAPQLFCIVFFLLAACRAGAGPAYDIQLDTSGLAPGQLSLAFFVTTNPPNNFSQTPLADSVVLNNFKGTALALDPSRRSVSGTLSGGITINETYYDAQPLVDFAPGKIEFNAQLDASSGSGDLFGVALILADGGVAHTDLPYSAFFYSDLSGPNPYFQTPDLPAGATASVSAVLANPEPASASLMIASALMLLRRGRRKVATQEDRLN